VASLTNNKEIQIKTAMRYTSSHLEKLLLTIRNSGEDVEKRELSFCGRNVN
jgi:hypothetical protein